MFLVVMATILKSDNSCANAPHFEIFNKQFGIFLMTEFTFGSNVP